MELITDGLLPQINEGSPKKAFRRLCKSGREARTPRSRVSMQLGAVIVALSSELGEDGRNTAKSPGDGLQPQGEPQLPPQVLGYDAARKILSDLSAEDLARAGFDPGKTGRFDRGRKRVV